MTTQSIIVYRNPLEAALWENMPTFVPIGFGMLVFLLAFYTTHTICGKLCGLWKANKWTNAILAFSAVVGCLAVYFI